MSIEPIQSTQFFSLQALSPAAQEEVETQAILNDPQVKKYLESIGAESTTVSPYAILDNGSKQYLVRTNTEYFIRVNVVYTPRGQDNNEIQILGPKKFTLDVHAPEIPRTYAKGLLFPAHQKV